MELSTIFSLSALGLSGLSTYMTFFNRRNRLTGTIVRAQGGINRGGSYDGSTGIATVSFRRGAYIEVLLANSGTLPLVLTDLVLVSGEAGRRAKPTSEPLRPFERVEPMLLEPKSAHVFKSEYTLSMDNHENVSRTTVFPERSERFWVRATIYDHRGRALKRDFPAFSSVMTYHEGEADDRYPDATIALDVTFRPTRLV